MSTDLHINGTMFQTPRAAAEHVSYSRDYITRLAREGKVRAVHLARNWYIDVQALQSYEAVSALETSIKNQHLRQQRQYEHLLQQRWHDMHTTQTQKHVVLLVRTFGVLALVLASGYITATQVSGALRASVADTLPSATGNSVEQGVDQPNMLQPTFTPAGRGQVMIDTTRFVAEPAVDASWQYITYE